MAGSAVTLEQQAAQFKNDPIMQQIAAGGSQSQDNSIKNAMSMLQDVSYQNNAQAALAASEARDFNARQTQLAMDYNAAEATKNRDWQSYMSNTAHQREVADLKAAGLNPILSASGGNGAAVTSGAAASTHGASASPAQTDMSINGALVNFMGSLLSAETQRRNTEVNAANNLAVADKYNAASALIAQITGEYSLRHAGISAGSAMAVQKSKEAQEAFMAQNYPSSTTGAMSAIAQGLLGGGIVAPVADAAQKFGTETKNFWDNIKQWFNTEILGVPEWSYGWQGSGAGRK